MAHPVDEAGLIAKESVDDIEEGDEADGPGEDNDAEGGAEVASFAGCFRRSSRDRGGGKPVQMW